MLDLNVKYDLWMNKLLDLGKRNRLLNFRDTARSTIKITFPEIDELYDFFVKEEKELVFPKDEETEENSEITDLSNVETNKSNSDLQKALRNLRNKAKTAIEEQGINVLYLAFGFVKWTEASFSRQPLLSPIVLVPASLTIESISAPYKLSLHEDEIIVNPTLAYKFENDYGIKLPDFDDALSIEEYLNMIEETIADAGWMVIRESAISLFSFLKINMYTDLKNHKQSIIDNPIIKAISGDNSSIKRIPESLENYDFDKQDRPENTYQIVDADASQQEAILMAKNGISFILQGPPGTGKSQTITNIIAECLMEGKKVLFVSEKMAALDVVHNRIAQAGLDEFCLVLHSHKANKKSVLSQLSSVFTLSGKKASLTDDVYQKLKSLQSDKEKLNEYAEQVFEIVRPLKKSIYEVNGIIANLNEYPDLIFSIPDIRDVSLEKYNRYLFYINEYSKVAGTNTADFKDNPWVGSNLMSVSNEFRHDFYSYADKLIPSLRDTATKSEKTYGSVLLDSSGNSVKKLLDTIALLEGLRETKAIPIEWINSDSMTSLFDEIEECKKIEEKTTSLIQEINDILNQIKNNDPSVTVSEVSFEKDTIDKLLNCLEIVLNKTPYVVWKNHPIDRIKMRVENAKTIADSINGIKDEINALYEDGIYSLDWEGVLGRIKTEYTSFAKVFKKTYKADKKSILLYRREITKKLSDSDMLWIVEKLKSINETRGWYNHNKESLYEIFNDAIVDENSDYETINRQILSFELINIVIEKCNLLSESIDSLLTQEETLKSHYSFLYNGFNTQWDEVRASLEWAVKFKELIAEKDVPYDFIKAVCSNDDFILRCNTAKEKLKSLWKSIEKDYNWFINNFEDHDVIQNMEFDVLCKKIESCKNTYKLEEWIDYRNARENCIKEGLDSFIEVIEAQNLKTDEILAIFKKRFFRLWLDAVLPEYPAVQRFRRKNHDETICDFSKLDKMQFEIAKARIKGYLINNLPNLDHFTSGIDETSILKREINKQRRIMPIRKLFMKIPNLLLTLKPCLMMSPLSVSLFLEASTYKFDVVIFDEASQVCTENAIGAISRAKQVIIAGDSKQLPPTNFFQAAVTDNDYDIDSDDDDDESNAYESILDEANMLPERTLRWHYRSRNEELIAFSNTKIYHNNLITFPSNIERIKDNGVEYTYVPTGRYDRGGKKGNVAEAEKVVDMIFEHISLHPERSLGVIAFGEVQQQAIETVLNRRRLEDQKYELFFAEDQEEAFFIKNLENVQGDERDTIIFSIGYAKDKNNIMRMNFGPLSKSGGERRLNVAITRAKYNVKLVGSIMPTDIDVDRVSAEGPKLLRSYIDFAINGQQVLEQNITESDLVEHDSPFEEAVFNYLDRKGYRLATQVGCSGYRIDIAVKHPTLSGVYVLGIECDGASYHSARTARERDRLRQDVLENMGWKIYRIWSTDWIKDPKTEGEKLIEAIESAIANYGVQESVQEEGLGIENFYEETEDESASFVNLEDKPQIGVFDRDQIYGFEKSKPLYLYQLRVESNTTRGYIIAIVEREYPIHTEVLYQIMAPLYGNEKVTVKVRREVDYGLYCLKDYLICKNGFWYPKDYDHITVRMPNTRKIQHISTEELAEAMMIILKQCYGATKDALCVETARVYGFNRTTSNIKEAMIKAVDTLIDSGRVTEEEDKLKIVDT